MTKLCRDCKWMREPGAFAKCTAQLNPANSGDAFTGFDGPSMDAKRYCATQRMHDRFDAFLLGRCGKYGRWFEPKEDDNGSKDRE